MPLTSATNSNSAHPSSSAKMSSTTSTQRRNGRNNGQDYNHLLGFTLPPRSAPASTHLPRRSTKRTHYHGGFDRQRFVHQFRYVVDPSKDYTAHFADPDIHLDWSDILQVILPTSSSALSTVSTSGIDQAVDGESGRKGGAIPTCPICLSEPTAARMTKCGHVFCYPCVLHYLALADHGQKFRKCPVCHDSIYAKDLKSVKWHDPVGAQLIAASTSSSTSTPSAPTPASSYEADLARALALSSLESSQKQQSTSRKQETLKMRLVRRPQITTLALPRSSTWPSEAVPPLRAPWQFTPDAFAYAKFMLGAPDYMRDELTAQKEELQREIATLRRWGQRGATDEELGVAFVEAASRRVDEQLQKVEGLKTTSVMTARKKSLREIHEIQEKKGKMSESASLPLLSETSSSEVEAEPEVVEPAVPEKEEEEEEVPLDFLSSRNPNSTTLSSNAPTFVPPPSLLTPLKKPPHQRRNVLPPPQPDEDPAFYFYQAASGQPIFLQPLDIRILKSHFGTYQAMPDSIEVVVEGADEGSMNEELRRRCKWLAHLPISSDVVFIESDLSRVVSKKSLEPYSTALKQRRNKRRDKARKEDKAKLKSEQKAAQALPIYPSTGEFGVPHSIPFSASSSYNAAPSSWDDFHAFPSPAPANPSRSPTAPATLSTSANSNPPSNTAASNWSNRSFASALHSTHSAVYDEDFDDRWNEVEESLGRQRIAAAGGGGGTPNGNAKTSANAGGGKKSGGGAGGGGGGKKSKKGITLNLSGGGMRGSG
ncbi:RING finger protein [Sporobolomyces salmoneus]|uniref:RING finger protein n=1 Tax=Sporobolomyces salmoneus TaxID=183962 RepID=UPI00316F6563